MSAVKTLSEAEVARRDSVSTQLLGWVNKNPKKTKDQIITESQKSIKNVDTKDIERALAVLLANKAIGAVEKLPTPPGQKGMGKSLYSASVR